jgi:hypothetical protein
MNAEFQENGYVILRGIAKHAAATWLEEYERLGTERAPEFNPVAVNNPKHTDLLDHIANWSPILNAVEQIFGPDIATYNRRFVVKDKHSRGAVFWHQDTGYHMGWPNKLSCFVALSPMNSQNGALLVEDGTHKYGFMGDAGELDWCALPNSTIDSRLIKLEPGDACLMHSACWHSSQPWRSGPDRILSDIIYQPASDPSSKAIVRGTGTLQPFPRAHPFIRSRVDRIKELETKVDELETQVDNLREEC